jgi:hypothetical protein
MHNELDIKKVSRRGLVTLIVGFIGFVGWGSLRQAMRLNNRSF